MLQIEPPTPTFMSVTDALVGGGNYWQNADFYNTQFKVLRSKGLGEKVVERLKLKDRRRSRTSPTRAALFMSHVGIEPDPGEPARADPGDAPRTRRRPRSGPTPWPTSTSSRRVATRVEAARKAYDWLQERLAATQKSMREAQDQLLQELPDARTCSCPRAASPR